MKAVFLISLVVILTISGCVISPQPTATTEIRYIYVTPQPTATTEIRYIYVTPQPTPIATQEPLLPLNMNLNTDWNSPIVPNYLDGAYADYAWRIALVNEQTGRVTTYYSIKSGIKMDQEESYAYMETTKKLLEEFIKRNKDAIYSGDNYAKLININMGNLDYRQSALEIWRINKNKEIYTHDINVAITGFNKQVESYNNCIVYKTVC